MRLFSQLSLKGLTLAALSGLVAGPAVALFLITLDSAVYFKSKYEWLLYLLPFAGLLIGRMKSIDSRKVIEEAHSPQDVLTLKMGTHVWLATITSHFFGASVGREGAAAHIGASFADQLTRILKLTGEARRTILICGLGAGFSAAVGTPLAGAIFGIELFGLKKAKRSLFFECALAAFFSFWISRWIHHPDPFFEAVPSLNVNLNLLIACSGAGMIFGFLALGFEGLHHFVAAIYAKYKVPPTYSPLIGGALFVLLITIFSLQPLEGLSMDVAREAFSNPSSLSTPLWKLILTALVLGSGFRGGEFTPLLVIGATSGAWIEGYLQTGTPVFAALGCGALFGTSARVPLTATIMLIEWFGLDYGIYAAAACFTAFGMKVLLYRKAKTTRVR